MSAPSMNHPARPIVNGDTNLLKLNAAAEQIEHVLEEHMAKLADPSVKRMARAIVTAQARQNVKALLTGEVMGLFMELMNQQDGFLTDRCDPHKPNERYTLETVRSCLMEGFFQGVYPFNNELNIIAGRMMVVKNGWAGKIEREFGCTPFYDNEIPDKGPGNTWKVHVYCWCKRDGKVIEIAGRDNTKGRTYLVSAYKDAVDSLLGKAQRRALRDLWRLLSGVSYDEEEGQPAPEEEKPTVKVEPVQPTAPAPSPQPPSEPAPELPLFARRKGWTATDAIRWALEQGCFASAADARNAYTACRERLVAEKPNGGPADMAIAWVADVANRVEESLPAPDGLPELENA